MSAIEGCSLITGDLYMTDNAALTNVDGMSSLATVRGDLEITDNAALCQDSVDEIVAGCVVDGEVTANDNNGACP
jgi:hypothetical protein